MTHFHGFKDTPAMTWWGWLLCCIGLHRWSKPILWLHGPDTYHGQVCLRCCCRTGVYQSTELL